MVINEYYTPENCRKEHSTELKSTLRNQHEYPTQNIVKRYVEKKRMNTRAL
jgi:hypothetical protein